ncbi:MAG: FtsX-like permease family protein [Planctomycetaceae bacterium]|nr:FtsX-like permease family protein [Planctomycetaceae bacterium]
MSTYRLLVDNLRHYWRTNLAVVLGVVAATAVIGGALVVGDSVRDSLRQMSLDRLGDVEYALTGGRFFREELAGEFDFSEGHFKAEVTVAPAITLTGSAAHERDDLRQRASGVATYGIDERFWSMMQTTEALPTEDKVFLNRRLADELGATVGDEISLIVEIPAAIPRDSLLGDRNETDTELVLTVTGIAEDATTPGRFGLNPAQQLPMNAFISLDTLQEAIEVDHRPATPRNPTEKPARVNALFVDVFGYGNSQPPELQDLNRELAKDVQLEDLALRLVTNEKHGYISLESEQMMLDNAVVLAARQAAGEVHASPLSVLTMRDKQMVKTRLPPLDVQRSPVLVYLLNELWNPHDDKRFSMYSVAAGIDFAEEQPFGPFEYVNGGPPQGSSSDAHIPVVINNWIAEDLGVGVGDTFNTKYQEVGDRGELPEHQQSFKVVGVIKLNGPAADPGFSPEVEGITDAETFDDWRQPFPMELDRVTSRDEEFWDEHRTTPKVFLRLDDAQRLWQSRYGDLTSYRIAPTDVTPLPELAADFERRFLALITGAMIRLEADPAIGRRMLRATEVDAQAPPSGLVFQSVREQGLNAASGTTDFTGLFIGFSFFLILAAMLLIGLLFRLGIERRVSELGLLSAVGLSPKQVRRLFLVEGAILTLVGGLLGCLAAVCYAALMIYGLKTWWFGAIGTKFLFLSVHTGSLIGGFIIAAVVAMLAVWWALRQTRGISTRELLAGTSEPSLDAAQKHQRGRRAGVMAGIAGGMAVCLLAATFAGLIPQTEAFSGFNWRVVTFFLVGVAALAGSLASLAWWLDADRAAAVRGQGVMGMIRLGLRNAARHRGRSVLTASLIASATFVIVAVAAGRRNPAVEQPVNASGNGGFTLVAETSTPILYDLNTSQGRAQAGMDLSGESEEQQIDAMRVMPFRVKPGENASCLNLYQTQLPTILGVPEDVIQTMSDEGRFKFADTPSDDPWELLTAKLDDNRIPVLGDMNTLLYSLHKGIGDLVHVPPGDNPGGTLQIEGMFDGSVFQGVLLMSEANFFKLFPDQTGFQYFLIETSPDQSSELSTILETQLADYGFDAERVSDRLASFLAVQNTYLSTFQTLGGLGLLLGTLGLATVMLRNVLERRGELALLRAVGFRAAHVAWLVLCENAFVMLWGLAAGALAALLAMTPHLMSTGADVPWGGLQAMLLCVFAVGMLAALFAVREAVRTPILTTLRSE